jgi:two-component system response regulator ChvI
MRMNEVNAGLFASALAGHAVDEIVRPRVVFVGDAPAPGFARLLERTGLSGLVVEPRREVIERASAYPADLALVQVRAPIAERIELLCVIRERLSCPVVLLAPNAEATDELIALEAGYDDVWSGLVDERLLAAKLRAQIRRNRRFAGSHAARTGCGGLTIDRAAALVMYAGRAIDLTRAQREALYLLIARQGHPVGRDELSEACRARSRNAPARARAVDTMISRLRDRLAAAGVDRLAIRAVHGHGYRIESTTQRSAARTDRPTQAIPTEASLAG